MKVGELMTEAVASVSPDEMLGEVARVMWDRDCGFVPVVNEEREVVGVVTDRDVCMAALIQGKSLYEIPVETAMTTEIRACSQDQKIDKALELMRTHQIHRLVVVDEGEVLAGVLSLSDAARSVTSSRTRANQNLRRQVADTFQRVTRPRSAVTA